MTVNTVATHMLKTIAQGVLLGLYLMLSCTSVSNDPIPTSHPWCMWASDCSDGSSIKGEMDTSPYTKEARQYQREVSTYLDKVRRGRRVAKADLSDPKFSEDAERERQLKPLGIIPNYLRSLDRKKKTSMIDPLDMMKSGLQALELNNGFDVNTHHNKMLTTGPFADAMKRQSVLHPELAQVGFGGGGNDAARQQLKALEQEDAALGITAPAPVPGIRSTVPIASADVAEKNRLKRVAEQDAIERKLGIGVKPKPETEDEHLRRLGLK